MTRITGVAVPGRQVVMRALGSNFYGEAVSTGQRKEFGEFLHRHPITKRLAWSSVETLLNSH